LLGCACVVAALGGLNGFAGLDGYNWVSHSVSWYGCRGRKHTCTAGLRRVAAVCVGSGRVKCCGDCCYQHEDGSDRVLREHHLEGRFFW
jgi:hypothetical protein